MLIIQMFGLYWIDSWICSMGRQWCGNLKSSRHNNRLKVTWERLTFLFLALLRMGVTSVLIHLKLGWAASGFTWCWWWKNKCLSCWINEFCVFICVRSWEKRLKWAVSCLCFHVRVRFWLVNAKNISDYCINRTCLDRIFTFCIYNSSPYSRAVTP